jgi:hypothetical protein
MKVKGKLLQLNLYMLTRLQKNNFGKIKKPPPPRLEPTPTQNSLLSPNHHPSPSTKASPTLSHLENNGQKFFMNKHFKFLNKGKLLITL